MVGEQVDDNGESYWIFESRDVRIHLFQSSFLRAERSTSPHGQPILSTLGECVSLHILDCLSENSNYLEVLLDCTIRLPGPLAWSLLCFPAQVQPIVSGASFTVYVYCPDPTCRTPLQIHPDRHACPRLQCYKRNRIHICVRILHIFSLGLTAFLSPSSDRDAKQRWAHNVVSSNWSMGGLGGQMLTGVVKNSVGRVFGS